MPSKRKKTRPYVKPRPKKHDFPFFARMVCRACGKDELSFFPDGIDNIHRQDIQCGHCRKRKAFILTPMDPAPPEGI